MALMDPSALLHNPFIPSPAPPELKKPRVGRKACVCLAKPAPLPGLAACTCRSGAARVITELCGRADRMQQRGARKLGTPPLRPSTTYPYLAWYECIYTDTRNGSHPLDGLRGSWKEKAEPGTASRTNQRGAITTKPRRPRHSNGTGLGEKLGEIRRAGRSTEMTTRRGRRWNVRSHIICDHYATVPS